jgi:hypothetical protein
LPVMMPILLPALAAAVAVIALSSISVRPAPRSAKIAVAPPSPTMDDASRPSNASLQVQAGFGSWPDLPVSAAPRFLRTRRYLDDSRSAPSHPWSVRIGEDPNAAPAGRPRQG